MKKGLLQTQKALFNYINGFARAACLGLSERMQLVQPFDEQQISQLFDDRKCQTDGDD